ncbi:MAG: MerR family transcriptional regulator [Myxococcales bacterium]|nr:MerR family transcriptional regulator [Myxococcales bacterium]
MAALAQASGVPAATIKHYLREGLLPPPQVKTGRNMAYYDAALVPRIRAIKQLQEQRYLPLRVIRDMLDASDPLRADQTHAALAKALGEMAPPGQRTRAELVAAGMPAAELDFLRGLGLLTPEGRGPDERYAGDDLALLRTLGAARAAGIGPDMLPPAILVPYLEAIRALVRTELVLFREGVVPRAGERLDAVVGAATELSERLVVLLRRKLLLPMLRELTAEPSAPAGLTGAVETARGRRGAGRAASATPRASGARRTNETRSGGPAHRRRET